MRKLLHIQRLILVSPEAVVIGLMLLLWMSWPDGLAEISRKSTSGGDVISLIGALPLLLVGVCWRFGKDILTPGDEAENRKLYAWPMYWALEARVYGSIALCALGFVTYCLQYLDPWDLSRPMRGVLLIGSLVVPATAVGTLLVAKMQIRKILTMHG